ncbi:sensor histidine kinase [Actinoplanes sp. NEAU-A12]|uniref:histidine kinase n=1 Tax=Actinoplanes sandaracinus TaxID=3045177 RepID=A0ABT6WKL6_9ACTN|nr:sensor histidine kinase [Actinoplanes sandaracinus]MDI6100274.1 sensor histidine kinase [Actinoplanes sandaracinus]
MRIRGDAALAVGVLALNAVTAGLDTGGADRPMMPLGWALLVLSSAALLGRQRFPLTVLAITSATTVAYYPAGFPDTAIVLNLAVALYTVGRRRGPAWSAGATAILLVLVAATSGEPWPTVIGVAPVLALPVVLGEFARGRARQTTQAEERAALAESSRALAEASRESEALRRAAEERLRIAREMHDALGHQLSLISVQAAAALHTREPDSAFEALRAIRTASKDALREMREVLGVLREPVQPDLSALPELFGRTSAAGLTVRPTVDVPPPAIPAEVQRAAYRIVQEALTNAVRHGAATRADVGIRRCGDRVLVTVENDGDEVPAPVPGSGLRGMAERAASVGGTLQAGPRPGGGFRVHAGLPLAVTTDENGTR